MAPGFRTEQREVREQMEDNMETHPDRLGHTEEQIRLTLFITSVVMFPAVEDKQQVALM